MDSGPSICIHFILLNTFCPHPGLCCCCSVAQLCPTLYDPMDCSTPGLLVLHHLLELAQTHVHWVSYAIQPSQPLLIPSPPAFNLSQHQCLPWISSASGDQSTGASASASFLLMNISFRIDWFDLLAVQGTLKSLFQYHSSKASISAQPSSQSNSHIHTWLLEKP